MKTFTNFIWFLYQLFLASAAATFSCALVEVYIYPLDDNVRLAHFLFFGLHYIIIEYVLKEVTNNATR